MSEQTAFGYGFFNTIAMCVPWSGRPLPPELTIAYKACLPPMNSNIVMVDTKAKPIDQARNYFAEIALQQKAKYMFFWDEDVLLPAHALRELIYVAENWRDIAVVAGIYCLKVEHPQPMVFKKPGEGVYWDWKVGEVFECYATGLGCSLIRVEALNDIEKPWFKSVDNMDRHLDAIPLTEQWTEDLYFAKKIMDGKKWKWIAHGGLVMPHVDVRNGRHYELPPDSKPMRHLAIEVGRKKILDVGSGGNPINTDEGRVVTVDAREDMHPDYRCDIRRLPMASEEYDIVWCAIPGQRVLTPSGWIAIERLNVGDWVVGRTGLTPVRNVFRYDFSGPVFSFKTSQGEAVVTGEHPIATPTGWTKANQFRKSTKAFMCPPEIKPSQFVDNRKILSIVGSLAALGPDSPMSVLESNSFLQKLKHQFSLFSFANKMGNKFFEYYTRFLMGTMYDNPIFLFGVNGSPATVLAEATGCPSGFNNFISCDQDFRIAIGNLNTTMNPGFTDSQRQTSFAINDPSEPSPFSIESIDHVSSYHYRGPIINLETGDNSFFLEGLLTHNSSHTLEHFSRAEAESTLAEWVRVMKPDGELRLLLPNLEWAAKRLLEFSDDPLAVTQALDVFYAQQTYDLDYHKNGFTPKLIEALLRKLGFKHIILDTPDYHIYIRAWKIKPKGFEQFKRANDPFLTRNVPARAYPTQLVKPKHNGKERQAV